MWLPTNRTRPMTMTTLTLTGFPRSRPRDSSDGVASYAFCSWLQGAAGIAVDYGVAPCGADDDADGGGG